MLSMSDQLQTESLRLAWARTPWDDAVCGFPVFQITDFLVTGTEANADFRIFERKRDDADVGLVSCRLPHDRLRESILLEDRGFRFIELVFRPEFDLSRFQQHVEAGELTVSRSTNEELPFLLAAAGQVFRNERFHVDPRLDPLAGDRRYQNWVASSHRHASQELYVVKSASQWVAFFVTEMLADGTCYWHLNAVSPQMQGRAYGRSAWIAMLRQAREAGAARVRTSIVARNFRVLNLYARLGFTFPAPLMTFHWVRPASATAS